VVVGAIIGSRGRTATEEAEKHEEIEKCAPYFCLVQSVTELAGRQSFV
jgi:hypothetical protein